jgi:DUSP domain
MECPRCNYEWSSEKYVPRILSCGHTICEVCSKDLFKVCKIQCPVCSGYNQFSIDRQFDDSDDSYSRKCIETMSKNFTLLSIINEKASGNKNKLKNDSLEVQICEDHDLPMHSYTEKPYSLLCDKCIEEIQDYGLNILPIPEVTKYFDDILGEILENLSNQKQESEVILDNYARLEKAELEKNEKILDTHFKIFHENVEETENEMTEKIEKLLLEQQEANSNCIQSINDKKLLIHDLEAQCNYFEELEDNELVKWSESFTNLLEKSKPPSEPSEKLSVCVQPNKIILGSIKELLDNSYRIDIKKTKDLWACGKCNYKNADRIVICEKCRCFRPLESYPNIINNPSSVTAQEIHELNLRRQMELQTISELDKNDFQSMFYLIHAGWINKWKEFVFNKSESSSSPAGVLPPGPISNHLLFTDSECKIPKPKLKAAIDYRGLNERVWEAYYNIYGGGPVLIRKKLTIYEENKKKN